MNALRVLLQRVGPDSRYFSLLSMGLRVVAAAILVLAIAEAVARVATPPVNEMPGELVRAPGTQPRTGRTRDAFEDSPLVIDDESLLWRGRPNASLILPVIPSAPGDSRTWKIDTDVRGFRRTTTPSPATTPYRILFTGDSVTLGYQVDQGREYPAVVAEILGERHAGLAVEILNAAVADWSWVQGTKFLLQEGLALAPDLVVAAHGVADQMRASITDSERLWLRDLASSAESGPSLVEHSAAWQFLAKRKNPRDEPAVQTLSPGCRLQEAAGDECRRVSLQEIRASVRVLGQAARAAGVDLVLLPFDFRGSGSTEAVHQAAVRDELRFVDFVQEMRRGLLEESMILSRDLGIAFPRVPLVPFGRIGPPRAEGRGPRVRFRMRAERASSSLRVKGAGAEETGFRFDASLHDDGIDGDEKAGDGVYSAFVETTPPVESLEYRYFDGAAPEFEVPAGILAGDAARRVRFNRDSDLAVERFGARKLMIDEIHPDAEGHRRIAEALASEIEKLPTFRRAAREAARGATR